VWDEDMPHNLDLHNNLLDQFTDVKQGEGDNDLLASVGRLPLVRQLGMVISKDISDEISAG
jgi:hypothetical protein